MESDLHQFLANPTQTLGSWNEAQIANFLHRASQAYYHGVAIINDSQFDMVQDALRRLNPNHPVLAEVGAPIPTGHIKVRLPYYMGSLDKLRDDPKQLERWKTKFPGNCVIMDKLDGMSVMLQVTNSGQRFLYKHGDGVIGQDITHLLPFISHIPKFDPGAEMVVRGELLFPKAQWDHVKQYGNDSNLRNIAAGTINATKNYNADALSRLHFVIYELLAPRSLIPSQALTTLKSGGIAVVWNQTYTVESLTMDGLLLLLKERILTTTYEVDGLVVYHDQIHQIVPNENPKYAFAFKSLETHEKGLVTVKSVEWNPSKDKILAPIVEFNPIRLDGANISSVTGINAKYMVENSIGVGAILEIVRSGGVIPRIIRIVTPAAQPSLPAEGTYEWNDTGVFFIQIAEDKKVILSRLTHFAKELDIVGVREGVLSKLYDANIDTIAKLVNIRREQMVGLPGFQSAMIEKVYQGIQAVKSGVPCQDLAAASNSFGHGMGKKKMKLIVDVYPDINQWPYLTAAHIEGIAGLGPSGADSFVKGVPAFMIFLAETGIQCQVPSSAPNAATQLSFAGHTVVFTGIRDKKLKDTLESLGARVTDSVSRNTTLVLTNTLGEGGAKMAKARELGIPIMLISEFKTRYGIL